MDWNRVLRFAVACLVVVALLYWSGTIGSFWAGVGVATIVFMFAGSTFLSSWKRTSQIALVLWVLITFLLPFLWISLPSQLQDALSSRDIRTETRAAETVRGHGAEAERALALYCTKREADLSRIIQERSVALLAIPFGDPTRVQMEKDLTKAAVAVEEWRKECTAPIQYATNGVHGAWIGLKNVVSHISIPTTNEGWYWAISVLLVFGLGIYTATLKGPWTKWVGGPMLLVMLVLLGYFLFFKTSVASEFIRNIERHATAGRQLETSTDIINPADPVAIQQKMDKEGITHLKVIVRPTGGEVAKTPFMGMPMCLPTGKFWYDIVPRDKTAVLRVKDKKGQLWSVQVGDYQSGPLPIILRGDLFVQIETEKEVIFVLDCFSS